MTIYLVHAGTGTIINAEDDVFILDTADLTAEDNDVLSDADDYEIVELAQEKGKRFQPNDLTWGNTIAYSPSAIRTEIEEVLAEKYPDDTEVLEWARTASNDELNEIANYIVSSDASWVDFHDNIMDGLREGLRWSKEKK